MRMTLIRDSKSCTRVKALNFERLTSKTVNLVLLSFQWLQSSVSAKQKAITLNLSGKYFFESAISLIISLITSKENYCNTVLNREIIGPMHEKAKQLLRAPWLQEDPQERTKCRTRT